MELHLGRKAAGIAVQKEATDWCREQLLPELEKRLEKYAGLEEAIQLDTVRIEMRVKKVQLSEALVKEIVALAEKEIEAQVAKGGKEKVLPVKREQRFVTVLLYYLQHGFLPWWTEIKSVQDFAAAWKEVESIPASGEEKEKLAILLSSPAVVERLIALPPEEIFFSVFAGEPLSLQTVKSHFHAVKELAGLIAEPSERQLFYSNVKQVSVQAFVKNSAFVLEEEIAKAAVRLLLTKYAVPAEAVQNTVPHLPVEKIIHRYISTTAGDAEPIENKTEKARVLNEKRETRGAIQKEKEEGLYISNAGLVIVAPFLPRFFKNTGIAENDKLNSVDLAIALLQWMTTGKDGYAEFDVVLPKILCGIEPEDSVAVIDPLPDVFKQEAGDLLQSVITHWAILKNTSVEGLRESFLQRNGKVSFVNDRWLLQVEQKGYDMLLQHLPWTISMIKLPWMKHLLLTEWM